MRSERQVKDRTRQPAKIQTLRSGQPSEIKIDSDFASTYSTKCRKPVIVNVVQNCNLGLPRR